MSTRFASLLVRELKEQTMLLGNTHRFAGFAVLKAPDVPSVLVEMGYISSSKDEALLSSSGHQKKLARAVRQAIENYFSLAGAGAPLLSPELRSIEVVKVHPPTIGFRGVPSCHKRLCCHNLTLI